MSEGKVVLVTGSTQGIGKATAMAFYQAGARVVFTGRSPEKLKALEKEIKDHSRARFVSVDFLKKTACRTLVEETVSHWGRIDVLINNCGGLETRGQFLDLDEEDWRKAFELNFMTAVTMSKLVIPVMQKNGGGRIVNVSSFTALQPGSFNPHYSAMKLALINLGKHLSLQFAKDNILVNTVSPGNIRTEDVSPEEMERIIPGVPLQRLGEPQEVAELIRYITSDSAGFLTGSNFVIDGGKIRGV